MIPIHAPGSVTPDHLRVRPDCPRVEQRGARHRPMKYEGPTGIRSVYFAPRARRRQWDGEIAIVEGEKKALLLDQLGYAAVGIIGVWGAHDAEVRRRERRWVLHPWLVGYVPLAAREVVVVADSDAGTNDGVRAGVHVLRRMLRDAGAAVRIVEVPVASDGAKQGIDDYFMAHGEAATRALLARPIRPAGAVRAPRAAQPPSAPTCSQEHLPQRAPTIDPPLPGEPVVLYGRRRQVPMHYFARLPAELACLRPIERQAGDPRPRVLGAAQRLLIARLASLADDYGTIVPERGDDIRAPSGCRELARWLGLRRHSTVEHHLDVLEQHQVILRDRPCGAPRAADTIQIAPFFWSWWGGGVRVWREHLSMEPAIVGADALLYLAATYGVIRTDGAGWTSAWSWGERTYESARVMRASIESNDALLVELRDQVRERIPLRDYGDTGLKCGLSPFTENHETTMMHVPDGLTRAGIVSDQAVVVFTFLIYAAGSRGPRPLTLSEIGSATGLASGDSVRRYIRELTTAGLVAVLGSRRRGARRYVAVMHEWMKGESMRFVASEDRDLNRERRRYVPRRWSDEIGEDERVADAVERTGSESLPVG